MSKVVISNVETKPIDTKKSSVKTRKRLWKLLVESFAILDTGDPPWFHWFTP